LGKLYRDVSGNANPDLVPFARLNVKEVGIASGSHLDADFLGFPMSIFLL
jgi:hypothetical protein